MIGQYLLKNSLRQQINISSLRHKITILKSFGQFVPRMENSFNLIIFIGSDKNTRNSITVQPL